MQASTLKSTSSIPIPPRLDASPAGVRQYMTDILHSVYHVPLQDATAFASNWRYGRGRELGLYDLSTFQSIFGGEVGALLYHYIAAQGTLFSNSPYHTAHISDSSKLKQKEDLFGMRQGAIILYTMLLASIAPALLAFVEVLRGNTDHISQMLTLSGVCFFCFGIAYGMMHEDGQA